MTKIRKATTEDIIRIHECLKDKIEVCGDHQCRFVDNHTDETVAAALGVGVASVANIRRKMFGNIRRAPNPCPEDREVRARFDDLIDRLNSLFNGELDDLKFWGGGGGVMITRLHEDLLALAGILAFAASVIVFCGAMA